MDYNLFTHYSNLFQLSFFGREINKLIRKVFISLIFNLKEQIINKVKGKKKIIMN